MHFQIYHQIMHYFLKFSFLPFLRNFFANSNIWLLPHQVKEQKAHFLLMVWFAADLPGVFRNQLQFWKKNFWTTDSVFLGLTCSVLSTQFPHKEYMITTDSLELSWPYFRRDASLIQSPTTLILCIMVSSFSCLCTQETWLNHPSPCHLFSFIVSFYIQTLSICLK